MKKIELESGSPIGGVITLPDTSKWLSAQTFRKRYMKRWKLTKLSLTSVYGWMDVELIENEYVRGAGLLINPKSLNVPPPKRGRPNKKGAQQ